LVSTCSGSRQCLWTSSLNVGQLVRARVSRSKS